MVSCRLRRNMHTTPQVINLDQKNHGKLLDQKDGEFQKIAQDVIDGQVVSAVYLIGDGFDGDWMKASLQYLCHTRKVFVGKNLYSKGRLLCRLYQGWEAGLAFCLYRRQ